MTENRPKQTIRRSGRQALGHLVERVDLLSAIREVVLIALSILLAFALDNWNDERKERRKEIVMLNQLHKALQADSADYAQNMFGYQAAGKSLDILLIELSKQRPVRDTVKANLWAVGSVNIFMLNSAPYESIKSEGFDLIENDTLRLQIINLYESTYSNWIKRIEDNVNSDYKQQSEQTMATILFVEKPFDQLTPGETQRVVQQLQIKANRRQLVQFRNTRYNLYNNYRVNQTMQLNVIAGLRKEINRLRNK